MKRILLTLLAVTLAVAAALTPAQAACSTAHIFTNGKVIICWTCGSTTTCMD
jgi:hypothetical protein